MAVDMAYTSHMNLHLNCCEYLKSYSVCFPLLPKCFARLMTQNCTMLSLMLYEFTHPAVGCVHSTLLKMVVALSISDEPYLTGSC